MGEKWKTRLWQPATTYYILIHLAISKLLCLMYRVAHMCVYYDHLNCVTGSRYFNDHTVHLNSKFYIYLHFETIPSVKLRLIKVCQCPSSRVILIRVYLKGGGESCEVSWSLRGFPTIALQLRLSPLVGSLILIACDCSHSLTC